MTTAEQIVSLARRNGTLAPAERALLGRLLEAAKSPEQRKAMRSFTVNTNSPRFCDVLYRQWGFKPQFIKEGGRNTDREARDVDALLALLRHHPGDRRLEVALLLSNRLTRLEMLNCGLDPDGRLRYSGTITGTETQRHVTRQSPTSTKRKPIGYNLHATPDGMKHLFPAPPGCDLYNVDLSGADGWTIAAECAALGDTTMLEDLRAGLKPAQAVYQLYQHGAAANGWLHERLIAEAATVPKTDWRYSGFKRAIWAICYGSGDQSLINKIAEESYKDEGKPIYMEAAAVRTFRQCVFDRYPGVPRRMQRINMLLKRDGALDFANGSRRQFLGDPEDSGVQREAYAAHPQVITTYCTSLAWRAMWYDADNIAEGSQRIARPLLLVHDSILWEAPQERRDWVRSKVPQWFGNPITIAGITLAIPWSGAYGDNWAEASNLPGHPAKGKL